MSYVVDFESFLISIPLLHPQFQSITKQEKPESRAEILILEFRINVIEMVMFATWKGYTCRDNMVER
jgi:hypothetical protein